MSREPWTHQRLIKFINAVVSDTLTDVFSPCYDHSKFHAMRHMGGSAEITTADSDEDVVRKLRDMFKQMEVLSCATKESIEGRFPNVFNDEKTETP
jgi:hypothetical protein